MSSTITANVMLLIASETLANSLGGTIVSNTAQASNLTANSTVVEFTMQGQSLPVTFGSSNNYPPVQVSVYAGANGNTTDQLLLNGTVYSTPDQQGCFLLNGLLVLKANGKSGGGNANQVWGGSMQVPQVALGGGAKTLSTFYVGAAANGNANVAMVSANTCNLSFFVLPQTGANTNASITSLAMWVSNGSTSGVI